GAVVVEIGIVVMRVTAARGLVPATVRRTAVVIAAVPPAARAASPAGEMAPAADSAGAHSTPAAVAASLPGARRRGQDEDSQRQCHHPPVVPDRFHCFPLSPRCRTGRRELEAITCCFIIQGFSSRSRGPTSFAAGMLLRSTLQSHASGSGGRATP